MGRTVIGSVVAHHGDAADPDLLEWIRQLLDRLLGLDPWTMVVLMGLLIAAAPLSLVSVYLIRRRRPGPGA